MLDDLLKLLGLTREVNVSKDGVTAFAQELSLSRFLLSCINFLSHFPLSPFSLSRAPLRGPASLWRASLGLTGFHWGCWKTLDGASHHQLTEVGEQAS